MHSDDPSTREETELQNLAVSADSAAALQPGTHVDAYVIRGVLGEGGMGRVYLAEQIRPVRREVALKLIREQVASPLARAYFDVERQALARMQHPAIAQVFDAGTTADGHPYLAMEVVAGQPITQFCHDQHLAVSQRLALFARVCRGVQHAHQKGIIHRDLKPANVLVHRVDGEPMPKIIDFGIAIGGHSPGRDAVVDSHTTDRAGTLIYMSPEQADQHGRHLDTRSDVYSLGVMLYEVLTDGDAAALTRSPHDSSPAIHRTLLAAIDSAPAQTAAATGSDALLQASRNVPAELRAVLRKALATAREDRYDSAAALADDLDRYRKKQPLSAWPPSSRYTLRKFAARHRLGLVAAAVAVIALASGIALALDGLTRARESATLARVEAAKSTRIADFVRSTLGGIDPDRAKGMDTRLMRLVLDSAAERAERELAAQPLVRSAIEQTIADSYSSLGELALADTHYEAAIAAGEAAGLAPAPLARLIVQRAENTMNIGHSKEAVTAAQGALTMLASLPATDRDRLYVESRLAGLESITGELAASRTRYLHVLDLQRRSFGNDDPDTLDSMLGLAVADSDMARYDEARPLYEAVIEHYRARYGDASSKTLNAINSLAVLELEQKQFAAAEKLLAAQLPLTQRMFGPEHPRTAILLGNLGGAIRQQGRNEEARPYYEKALALARKLYGPDHLRTVAAEINLALLLRDSGELPLAEQHGRSAVAHAAAAFGDNPYRGVIYRELATILIREKKYAAAERELDLAWGILAPAKAYGANHPRSQDVVDSYLELYADWGKPERAALWRTRKIDAVAATPSRR